MITDCPYVDPKQVSAMRDVKVMRMSTCTHMYKRTCITVCIKYFNENLFVVSNKSDVLIYKV